MKETLAVLNNSFPSTSKDHTMYDCIFNNKNDVLSYILNLQIKISKEIKYTFK